MGWKEGVLKLLERKAGEPVKILSESYVGGGSINDTRAIKTTSGNFFIKINSALRYPGMFEAEAKGLQILSSTGLIQTPEVVDYGTNGNDAFLILRLIKSAPKRVNFWEVFGRTIALLHKTGNDYFGLDHDNYIGSLYQSNTPHKTWEDFFRRERMEPQIKAAFDSRKIDRTIVKMFDKFFSHIDNIFPKEPPALVHGDLWSGNFMTNENGEAVIIDPAVYFGHREMDIGMSKLFGGFDSDFYEAYNQSYPLEPNWEERIDFCNLYPLMVHVNIFGEGYSSSVKSILKRF